jgi:hypothetical protein
VLGRRARPHVVDGALAQGVGVAGCGRRTRALRRALRLAAASLAAALAGGAFADDDAPASPVWSVDPTAPGPAPPAQGRSLFDHLFTDVVDGRPVYAVPFPFDALLERLNERSAGNVRAVLIPLGRSLQRGAAYPDFFESPRAVAAIVGNGPASDASAPLENRLFVGYQERSAVIEVISYNETAGRFEFQIVSNYRADSEPDVRYAARSTCLPCHQSHGPIFSRPLWDETNANAEVGARLAAVQQTFFGVPARIGVDVPDAFDTATDRANRLSVWQKIWIDGCGRGAAGVDCRADLLAATLRYVLAGGRHLRGPDGERGRIAQTLRARWTEAWPGGLAIPNPDIPNRRLSLSHYARGPLDLPGPLQLGEPLSRTEIAALAAVLPEHEPITPRPPLEVWHAADFGDARVDELVAGLASFLTPRDAALLDALLSARREDGPRTALDIPCRTRSSARANAGSAERYQVACGSADTGARLDATLLLDPRAAADGAVGRGTVHRLSLPGGERLRASTLTVARTAGGTPQRLDLRVAAGPAGLRTAAGDAILRVALVRGNASDENATLSIEIAHDFADVLDGIERIAARARAGDSDALDAMPFRRRALLAELFAALNGTYPGGCCDEAAMPPALPLGSDDR